MSEKRVLIITYYWPPSGGSGVQRWLKFVKYLPQFGWKPFVFTPQNPAFEVRDESLLKDVPAEAQVIHFPIWEPYGIFNKLSGRSETATNSVPKGDSLFKKLSLWIRANIFIPDPRVFWVKPSVNFLHQYLREQNIQTIITTGPPHSVHLIGLDLKKKNPSLNWIADFRDPWSEWGFLETLPLMSAVKKIHRKLERRVLINASKVLTVTPSWMKMFERLGGREVKLLTNGFDADDFRDIVYKKSDHFIIRHVGVVNERCDPRPFMRAIESLAQSNVEFGKNVRVEFIGSVHESFKSFISSNLVLKQRTSFIAPMPHDALVSSYGSASVLLLVLTGYKNPESYLPGKLFEYIATGLPILGIGPTTGDAAAILANYQNGAMIEGEDLQAIVSKLEEHWRLWLTPNDHVSLEATENIKYDRKSITEQLTTLLR